MMDRRAIGARGPELRAHRDGHDQEQDQDHARADVVRVFLDCGLPAATMRGAFS